MTNIATIPAGENFIETLSKYLLEKNETLGNYTIFLPTGRARNELKKHLIKKTKSLPQIYKLNEIDDYEHDNTDIDIKPAISDIQRQIILTRLIKKAYKDVTVEQALLSGQSLSAFIDSCLISSTDLQKIASKIANDETLKIAGLSRHSEKNLTFLKIIGDSWQDILSEEGYIDKIQRHNLITEHKIKSWKNSGSKNPIIIAGSTGSIPGTARLMSAAAALENGLVILPGLDTELDVSFDRTVSDKIDETHPQYNMIKLLHSMSITDLTSIPKISYTSQNTARQRLLRAAFLPANMTDEWSRLQKETKDDGLSFFKFENKYQEALGISIKIKETLASSEKTVMLVTNDRTLSKLVSEILKRWDIKIEDTKPPDLNSTQVGDFLLLVSRALKKTETTLDWLAILKHPLYVCENDEHILAYELSQREYKHHSDDEAYTKTNAMSDKGNVCKALIAEMKEKYGFDINTRLSLKEIFEKHIELAEKLANAKTLWDTEEGQQIKEIFDSKYAKHIDNISIDDYASLLKTFFAAAAIKNNAAKDYNPRLMIAGTFEARCLNADVIILGGLNEGSFPLSTPANPWLSFSMQKKYGLASPDIRIGLGAHDFYTLASFKQVIMTRACSEDSVPSVESRFTRMLTTVMNALGSVSGGYELPKLAKSLDAAKVSKCCDKPAPNPPPDARPKLVHVTDIAKWKQNPYYIYAKYVLKFLPLESIEQDLGAADKGTLIHKVLEEFTKKYPAELPKNVKEEFLKIAYEAYKKLPAIQTEVTWKAQLSDIADWIIEQETEHRNNAVKILAEQRGKMEIDLEDITFTIKGKADRIEISKDNKITIIDYKTGEPPGRKKIEDFSEPQLPLLGLIAMNNGFENLPKNSEVTGLEYWKISTNSTKCKALEYKSYFIENSLRQLKDLIAPYYNKTSPSPYKATDELKYDDYKHLSRIKEWEK
ncbi:MAG: PD-(D/E)XK nuclease family protein [Alphaproteobacteria bacterium]|nr:PD-(D/E)XK nuclease family protein [Alphaproteobacteria bacterium]MCL2504860.1 PD-(D/E)XK nuclease family protein [Alphaproteobacteria bacterium]